MPLYEYVALDANGRQVKGSFDAENVRAARQRLRGQKIYPTSIKESALGAKIDTKDLGRYFARERVSLKEVSVATRQLATLTGAGLPLVSALLALADQCDNQTLKRIVIKVKEDVEEGSTFAKSLAKYPKVFPNLYVNLVASGEASGTLDAVLDNLADYLEVQVEMRRKVMSALMYPIIMLFLCTGTLIALLVFVVPRIVEIFIKQNAPLPLPTKFVIAVSQMIISYWYLMVLLAVGVVALVRWYYSKKDGRFVIDRILLKLPLYGSSFIKVNTARIAGTLSTLLSSGVGLLEALDIAKNITTNVHMVQALEEARVGVQEGRSLAKELSRTGIFPMMLSHMIAVGEKSGELEAMLKKVAKAYESEVNAALGRITTLLEPLMMVGVGGIVLFIMLSILLPMADLINVIQK